MKIVKNNINLLLLRKGYISKLFGLLNGILHNIIIYGLTIIGIFSFDIKILSYSLLLTIFILIGNIILHDCPLSNIEEERLGDSYVDFINSFFPINYKKENRYSVQLQYIFTLTSIFMSKIIYHFIVKDLVNYFNLF